MQVSKEFYQKILKALKALLDDVTEGHTPNSSICNTLPDYNIDYTLQKYVLRKYLKTWKYFSGDPVFPVPGEKRKYDVKEYRALRSYQKHKANKTLWKGEQRYYRISLLKHFIKKVRKELEKLEN